MKRTLALFLTLCMALSMFSFPAFAAEADVAVLDEAALVETETTPVAPVEEVTAPVAATLTKLTVTPDSTDRSNLTYTGAGVTVAEPTVSGGDKNTDYTIKADSPYRDLVDVGNRTITWTVALTQAGIDKGYTFGETNAEQVTSTTVDNVVNIKPYDWAGSSNVDVQITLTRTKVDETPVLAITDITADAATVAVKAEILAAVKAAYAADPAILKLTVGEGQTAFDVTGKTLSELAGKTGTVTGTIKVADGANGNWKGGEIKITSTPSDLQGDAAEGSVTVNWASSYKYRSTALGFDELVKGVKMSDDSAPTADATKIYMMTAAEKAAIDKAQDTEANRITEYKKKTELSGSKSELLEADAGDYVLYVESASATVKGGACFNVTVAPYTVAEVKAMLSVAPDTKTEIAYVGDTDTGSKVTAALKAPIAKAPAGTTGLTVTLAAPKYAVVSGGALVDADTAPSKEGTYKVTYSTVEQKGAADVVNVPSVEYSYNFTVKKMGFVFDTNIVLDAIDNASATNSVQTEFDNQTITVKNGNGETLTKTTDYEFKNVKYYKPDGSVDNGGTTLKNAAGNWKVTYDVTAASGKEFYQTTSGTMTIPVEKAISGTALALDFTKVAFPADFDYGAMPADFLKDLNAALDNVVVNFGATAITDYTVKCEYNEIGSSEKTPVTDYSTIKNAGDYIWTFSYDPHDGTVVTPVTKKLTISQKTLTTVKLVNLTMEITENTPDKPVVTEDNIFVADLAKGDTKADLFKDMTFKWDGSAPDMKKAGNHGTVIATLKSVNYTASISNGTMTATGKMDSEIVVTGETEFVYDGKGHTLTASLTGGAANEPTDKPTASITYTDAAGKVVAAPKNVGVYTATATMINKGDHDALDVVKTVTITAATPTLAFKALPDEKTVPYNSASGNFGTLAKGTNVAMTGVTGEALTDTYLDLYWADASGSQLWTGKDKDGNDIVTADKSAFTGTPVVVALDNGPKLPGDYYLTAKYVVVDPDTGKLNPSAGTVDANYTDSAVISEKFTITASDTKLDQVATFEDAAKDGTVNTIHYGDVLEGAVLVDLSATSTNTTGMLTGKYVITKAATEKANKVGEASYTVKFIPSDAGYSPVELTRKATVEVMPAVFTKDVQFKINNTSVSYDGKAHTLGEAVGAGVTILKDGLAFAGDDAGFKVEYSADKSTWTTDVTKFAYTNKGGYAVYVKLTDSKGNYVMPSGDPFMGKVSIGVVAATLKVEDKTVTYSNKGTPSVNVNLYDASGKLLTNVPDTAYTVQFHKATNHPNDESFAEYDTNVKLHAADKAYWVEVKLANAGYLGYSVEDNVAYGRYTVNKATLTTANLSKIVNKTTLTTSAAFDGTATVATTFNSSAVDGLLGENKAKTDEIAGTWDWAKNADGTAYPLLEVATNYDLVYNVTNTGENAPKASDFNTMAKTITVKGVQPGEVTVNEDVSVTPDKGTYGLTVGELTLKNPSDTSDFTFTFGGQPIKGALAFNDPADTVIPMAKTGDTSTELGLVFIPSTGKAANYKLDETHNSVAVTLEKAEPVITVTNTTMAYTGNPASLKVESNNTEADPTLTWYDANGNTMAGAPTQIGKYKVKVSLPETKSFKARSVTVDYEITYNQTGIEGFVYRLYSVALGREPDQSGYTMWVNLLKSKEYTPKTVAEGFIFSREFTNRKYDNATFLNVMYKTFMDRAPDASGYAMWLKGLNSGEYTREFVFNGFADSKEFTNICKRFGL